MDLTANAPSISATPLNRLLVSCYRLLFVRTSIKFALREKPRLNPEHIRNRNLYLTMSSRFNKNHTLIFFTSVVPKITDMSSDLPVAKELLSDTAKLAKNVAYPKIFSPVIFYYQLRSQRRYLGRYSNFQLQHSRIWLVMLIIRILEILH